MALEVSVALLHCISLVPELALLVYLTQTQLKSQISTDRLHTKIVHLEWKRPNLLKDQFYNSTLISKLILTNSLPFKICINFRNTTSSSMGLIILNVDTLSTIFVWEMVRNFWVVLVSDGKGKLLVMVVKMHHATDVFGATNKKLQVAVQLLVSLGCYLVL